MMHMQSLTGVIWIPIIYDIFPASIKITSFSVHKNLGLQLVHNKCVKAN